MDQRSDVECKALWQLNELPKLYTVEIYTLNGEAIVELYPQRIVGRSNVEDIQARYIETDLKIAIGRAWAVEPSDV